MRSIFKRRSLKWRLVSRFSLALGSMMVVFYAVLIGLIVAELPDVNPVDDTLRGEIAASIHRDGDVLRIVPTDIVETTVNGFPDFWIVARDHEGRMARIGRIPADLEPIVSDMDVLSALDVRVDQHSPMTASLVSLDTDSGPVKVIYGGKSAPGSVLEYMIRVLHVIYLPSIFIPLLLAVVVIPLVVNSSLKGMKRMTALAEEIDVSKPGVRLPTADIVEEIAPFVKTINAALARMDSDVSARERFLADAAHELRTPIAILQARIEGYEDTDQNRRLLLDVARIGAIAEQLLDIQRFAAAPVLVATDLVALCRQVVADLAPLAINKGYDLAFETETRSVVVPVDRLSVERAVTNLVRNAIQHAGERGQILVQLSSDGAIEVSDEGDGIAPEDCEKIFDPFYRSRPKASGAGLGLSLVRQIARLHGGDAIVLPVKAGARFRLTVGKPSTTR